MIPITDSIQNFFLLQNNFMRSIEFNRIPDLPNLNTKTWRNHYLDNSSIYIYCPFVLLLIQNDLDICAAFNYKTCFIAKMNIIIADIPLIEKQRIHSQKLKLKFAF